MTRYGPTDGNPGAPGELVGNYVPADEADVREGVQYGANGTEFTGTLIDAGNITSPAVGDVRNGVVYGLYDALTGVLQLPPESVVLLGFGYGANGVEFYGTYRVSSAEDVFTEDLIIGDDYIDALGRDLSFEVTVSFTPVTSSLKFWNCSRGEYTSTDAIIASLGNSEWSIRHQVLGSDTSAALKEGLYRWALTLADAAGNQATVNYGDCDVGRVEWVSSDATEC